MAREAKQTILITDFSRLTNEFAEVVDGAQLTYSLTNGTGDDQIDRVWHARNDFELTVPTAPSVLTINLRASTSVDIGGGSGKDELGLDALFLEDIVYIRMTNKGSNTIQWIGSSSPWGGITSISNGVPDMNLFPGAQFVYVTPKDGTASTTSLLFNLELQCPSGTSELELLICGRST